MLVTFRDNSLGQRVFGLDFDGSGESKKCQSGSTGFR